MKTSKLLTVLLSVLTAVILLTAAIAVPILCRPFYYAHIEPMGLCEQTGLTRDEIKTAFDEMMDFCLGGEEFSTGVLRWSEEGKAHFTDVRVLFLFDLRVLAISVIALILILVISRLSRRKPGRILRRGYTFWAGGGLAAVFVIVGALAAADFDRAFTIFHTLFFPGKDNWLFHPSKDQIINILPQDFFMHCALLILVILLVGCLALILWDVIPRRKKASIDSSTSPSS